MRVGPQTPGHGTPARRVPSLRRTTSHTCLRPDGLLGDVRLVAHGRDLLTRSDGTVETLGESQVEAEVDFINDRLVKTLLTDPMVASTERLEGLRASSGFRKAVAETVEEGEGGGSLTYQLLDDLPTALLVSGVVLASAAMYPPRGFAVMAARADICAGWATGGTLMVEGERIGHPPYLVGPEAPPLEPADADPLAWHPVQPMGPHSTCRKRRIDVSSGQSGSNAGATILVDAFFRDSEADADTVETVVHEYRVSAELETDTLRFLSCDTEIGVLPWVECPSAAASATRLVGTTPHDLRDRIRETFVGTTTCTHLNDTLRALAALPYLVGALDAAELRR